MSVHAIKLIGVGGIGTCLLTFLSRFLIYQREETFVLTLIDGDDFDACNIARQEFSEQGNKAEVKARDLRRLFPSLTVLAIPTYVTPDTVRKLVGQGDIVILAVDNHRTRLLVSQRCQELGTVTLISAGNELVNGNVQVYIRKRGRDKTHPIEFFHPEIQDPQDQNPGEVEDCFQMAAEGTPQLVITNMAAAVCIAGALFQILEGRVPSEEIYFNVGTGVFRPTERKMHVRHTASHSPGRRERS